MDKLAQQFADLAEKYGPSVADAAMSAARIHGYSVLIASIIWFVFSGLLIIGGRKLWNRKPADQDDQFDRDVPNAFGYVAFILAVVFGAAGVWSWIDPWTWISITNPDLYLAKKAFGL
jgi:uncharacterized membrane protein YidH (DUF202 family)